MSVIEIILATLGVLMIFEGLIVAAFPNELKKALTAIFKNKKKAVKLGLIEIIIGLAILFLIAL